MVARVVVVGAGLAGLSSAIFLARQGAKVELFEAAGHAGGRCRSYLDEKLGCRIDNGNHLLLSGNSATFEYLTEIGSADSLIGPDIAEFPFVDLQTEERWILRPNRGRVPWWMLSEARRVPGTHISEYLRGVGLKKAGHDRTVADVLNGKGKLYRRFWEPLALAVMNTAPEEAAAMLLWPVLRETLGKGEQAYRPRIVREGLTESFVDPALRYLEERNIPIHFGARLRGLDFAGNRVEMLRFADRDVALGHDDGVVLAVPPFICRAVVPGAETPDSFNPIVNVHFRTDFPPTVPLLTGVVGGVAQWVFVRGGIVSVTVSAARDLAGTSPLGIAETIWSDISRVLDLGEETLPPWRVVKEKRATFAQTPEQVGRRPGTRTTWRNLFLAGDWTATGLPATIEGAVRSGMTAARAALDG